MSPLLAPVLLLVASLYVVFISTSCILLIQIGACHQASRRAPATQSAAGVALSQHPSQAQYLASHVTGKSCHCSTSICLSVCMCARPCLSVSMYMPLWFMCRWAMQVRWSPAVWLHLATLLPWPHPQQEDQSFCGRLGMADLVAALHHCELASTFRPCPQHVRSGCLH